MCLLFFLTEIQVKVLKVMSTYLSICLFMCVCILSTYVQHIHTYIHIHMYICILYFQNYDHCPHCFVIFTFPEQHRVNIFPCFVFHNIISSNMLLGQISIIQKSMKMVHCMLRCLPPNSTINDTSSHCSLRVIPGTISGTSNLCAAGMSGYRAHSCRQKRLSGNTGPLFK